MKTFIYSSIIAFVFLCGCKGNAFLSQHYTHYSHASAKPAKHDVAVHKESPRVYQPEMVATVPVKETVQQSLASVDNSAANTVAAERPAAKHNRMFNAPKVKDLAGMVTLPSQKVIKNLSKKNTATSHRGLIFGLIDLALFIVITAVIVAAIIILVLIIL